MNGRQEKFDELASVLFLLQTAIVLSWRLTLFDSQ